MKHEDKQGCHHGNLTDINSPSVPVSTVNIDPRLHQELDDICLAGTHSIVERCDPLIVGLTGVVHLDGKRDTKLYQPRSQVSQNGCGQGPGHKNPYRKTQYCLLLSSPAQLPKSSLKRS